MIQNYLKIALRNLVKNKVFSFINIAGLAVGLASTMLLALWVLDEYSFENFQEKKNVLFQGKRNFKESENDIFTSTSQSGLTAEYIRKNFPEVKNAIITDWGTNTIISYGEKKLKKTWSSVEMPFFEMFTFPFVKGSAKTAFTDINSVVLTESMAKALFGDEDPINKLVKIDFNPADKSSYFPLLRLYKATKEFFMEESASSIIEKHMSNFHDQFIKEDVNDETADKDTTIEFNYYDLSNKFYELKLFTTFISKLSECEESLSSRTAISELENKAA